MTSICELQGETKMMVQFYAAICFIGLDHYFCSTLYVHMLDQSSANNQVIGALQQNLGNEKVMTYRITA